MLEHVAMDESIMLNKGINQVVEWMKVSKNIIFMGVGSSFMIIKVMKNKLSDMHQKISYIDSEQIDEDLMNEDTLLIAISYSGTTKEVLDTIQLVRNRGGKTIGITAFKDSPLMSEVHLPLICARTISQMGNKNICHQPSLVEILDIICSLYNQEVQQDIVKKSNRQ